MNGIKHVDINSIVRLTLMSLDIDWASENEKKISKTTSVVLDINSRSFNNNFGFLDGLAEPSLDTLAAEHSCHRRSCL